MQLASFQRRFGARTRRETGFASRPDPAGKGDGLRHWRSPQSGLEKQSRVGGLLDITGQYTRAPQMFAALLVRIWIIAHVTSSLLHHVMIGTHQG